jgi:aspartokinase/homoserine dehydrogenase 1
LLNDKGGTMAFYGTSRTVYASHNTTLNSAFMKHVLTYEADGKPIALGEAVRRAKEQGYSEPDPRIDLSGKDVIRKLVILAREAGYKVEKTDVEKHLFIPDEFFEGSIEEFWKNLPQLDADFEARRKQLDAEGKRWRFVATFDHGKLSVALKEVDRTHPFYNLQGSNNIVALTTERYREYPMLIQGYGAGASVTAAGVFANIMSIANI